MWLLFFSAVFSQLGPTQNATPSIRHGDCSTAHQRRLAELPQLFPAQLPSCSTAMSVQRCSGPSCRSRASRHRRHSGSASAKAPRASSTSASLGRGSPRESKSFHGSREGTFLLFVVSWHIFWIQISGEKTRFWDSNCF